MKRWLWRLALIGGSLAIGGFIVAASGVIPIKASSGHWPITEWFLRFSMKRSLATHSLTLKVPGNLADRSLVTKGAGYYEVGCRSCHGEPGMPQPRIAAHMLPTPPDLAPRIRDSDPKKLFYVVKHGMKFTGMPAWPSPQRDDEVWAVVAFLLEYPQLDATAYRRLVGRDEISALHADSAPALRVPPAVTQSCATCHGRDGHGRDVDTMPLLAGQRAPYLRKALEAYASGQRHSGMMEPVAGALTREAIEEVTGYYAGLRSERAASPSVQDRGASSEAARRGALIATEGIRAQRVPACVECHGPGAKRGKPEYPRLAGQRAGYLELQLTLFREGRRGGSDHAHLMQPIATRLKPEQARDVAAYFASLAADATPQAAP
jgi:cytochrome c553